ncbi:MAG: hypothetical protein JNJ54_13550 [Myxococcaceae bacterium]|nr:hypothetical protein [Myxococcaceae bacterium]
MSWLMRAVGLAAIAVALPVAAQRTPQQGTPDTRGTSLAGGWFVRSSAPRVSGICPPGQALMGGAHVDQTGHQVRLRFTIGFTCQPPAVCQYEGTIAGARLTLSNSVVVDDEGGRVKNTLDLVIESNDSLTGKSTSTYQHPDGDSCTWTSSVEISRKPDDGSQDSTRSGPRVRAPSTGATTTGTSGTSGTNGEAPPGTGRDTSTPGTGTGGTGTGGTSGSAPPGTGQDTSTPGTGTGGTTPTTPPGAGGRSTPPSSTAGPGTSGTRPGASGPSTPPSSSSGSGSSGATPPGTSPPAGAPGTGAPTSGNQPAPPTDSSGTQSGPPGGGRPPGSGKGPRSGPPAPKP